MFWIWFKNLFSNRFKKYEYIYFYFLNSDFFTINMSVRSELMIKIKNDMEKMNKTQKDWEIFTNKQSGEDVVIVATTTFNNIYIKPILLEIYAFVKKNKDFSIIKYPKTELDVPFVDQKDNEKKVVKIYKYKIEC